MSDIGYVVTYGSAALVGLLAIAMTLIGLLKKGGRPHDDV